MRVALSRRKALQALHGYQAGVRGLAALHDEVLAKKPLVLVMVLMTLGLTGCWKTSSPELRVETKSGDSVRPADGNIVPGEPAHPEIVTGVPATVSDDGNSPKTEAEDKPGAVAVKMEY